MSEFFKQIEKKEKYYCKASSSVYKEDNIEFKFFYNRSISCSFVDKNIDILILLEYWEKKEINQTQIRTLTALRDTLLPKLMSGEVTVEQ